MITKTQLETDYTKFSYDYFNIAGKNSIELSWVQK